MTREWLISMLGIVLRRRVWFSVLSKVERGLVKLTIKFVNRIKNGRLALAVYCR